MTMQDFFVVPVLLPTASRGLLGVFAHTNTFALPWGFDGIFQ